MMNEITRTMAIAVAMVLYFVPTVIAFWRHHPHRFWIAATNVLLGSIFYCWVPCLVWSLWPLRAKQGESGWFNHDHF